MTAHNLAFVKTIDIDNLSKAITFVNRARRYPFRYKRIIQTTPRNGWIALILNSPIPDHYLLRNISGRMNIRTFEVSTNGFSMSYRLHSNGKTIAAYESHLSLWVTQQLRALMSTGDVSQIDLAEPAGRLILKRYHEYRRQWSWSASNANESVTSDITWHYAGRAEDLKELLDNGTEIQYVQDMIKPGLSVESAFARLIEVLDMPYIKGEPVVVDVDESETAKTSDSDALSKLSTGELANAFRSQRLIRGLDVLSPTTWPNGATMPKGWIVLTEEQWKSPTATQA